jgi:hypothetical protein
MQSIISTGGIPLACVEINKQGEVRLKVTRMTHGTPFVALSHVWSDGLGNPAANSLPQCQLLRLQRNVLDLRQSKLNFQTGIINIGALQWDQIRMTNDLSMKWFWLDTLCIL